ncbi:MAG: DUF4136 domain-containing protein [Alphaproteobacteria bacterium]
MANKAKLLLILAASIAITGCAGKFRSDVSSWHRLQQPSGETFAIVAGDESKRGGLEFAQYSGLVAEKLRMIGYRPVQQGAAPDLIVRVDYGIGDPRTQIRSYGYGGPFYGYSHWGHFRRPYGYGYPYAHGGTDIRSYPLYMRRLEMEIAAANNPDVNLFESRVMSEGRSNRLEEVMPLLVESMFQDFPGPSGVTREVTIDLEDGTSRY